MKSEKIPIAIALIIALLGTIIFFFSSYLTTAAFLYASLGNGEKGALAEVVPQHIDVPRSPNSAPSQQYTFDTLQFSVKNEWGEPEKKTRGTSGGSLTFADKRKISVLLIEKIPSFFEDENNQSIFTKFPDDIVLNLRSIMEKKSPYEQRLFILERHPSELNPFMRSTTLKTHAILIILKTIDIIEAKKIYAFTKEPFNGILFENEKSSIAELYTADGRGYSLIMSNISRNDMFDIINSSALVSAP